jgi:hypothetical protein
MVARRLGAALALSAMLTPVAGYAAGAQLGTVAPGSDALIVRDGKVVSATAGAPIYAGDRVVTRANGTARVQMAGGCSVSLGNSAMLPVSASACSKPSTVAFDQGRAGYGGSSSAFQDDHDHTGLYLAGGAFLLGLAGGLYVILHNDHHHHVTPTSP